MLYLAPIFVLYGINAVGGISLQSCSPHEPFGRCHLVKLLHPVRRAAKCRLDSGHDGIGDKDAEKSKEEHCNKLPHKEEYRPIEENRHGIFHDFRTHVPAFVRPYPEPVTDNYVRCVEDNRYPHNPTIEDCSRPPCPHIPYNPFFNPDYSCAPFNPCKTQNGFSWSPHSCFPNSFSPHPRCFPHSFFPPFCNPYYYHNPCFPQSYCPPPVSRYPFPPYSTEPYNCMLYRSQ